MKPVLALDFDGTLITAAPKQINLLSALLRARGLQLDLGPIWQLKRDGASTKSALVEKGLAVDLAQTLSQDWIAAIETPYWQSFDCILPGVKEFLTELKSEFDCVIISARQHAHLLHQQIWRLGLFDYISAVHRVQPNYASIEKANILLRIGAVAFIGDTESDAKAAELANVSFAAVSTGQRSDAFLRTTGVAEVHDVFRTAVKSVTYPMIHRAP